MEGDTVQPVLPWDAVERICWKIARKLWHDGTLDCADLVQEALLHIWQKGGTDAGVAMSSGLVGTVAYNRMVDRLRQWSHHDRRTKTTPAACVPEDLAFGLHSPDEIDTLIAALDAAPIINAMPKRMQHDLLRTALGYSVDEVAAERGVTRHSIYMNATLAHKRLRAA